jgi:hypothetical protein
MCRAVVNKLLFALFGFFFIFLIDLKSRWWGETKMKQKICLLIIALLVLCVTVAADVNYSSTLITDEDIMARFDLCGEDVDVTINGGDVTENGSFSVTHNQYVSGSGGTSLESVLYNLGDILKSINGKRYRRDAEYSERFFVDKFLDFLNRYLTPLFDMTNAKYESLAYSIKDIDTRLYLLENNGKFYIVCIIKNF